MTYVDKEQALFTGSHDSTVKMWDVHTGLLPPGRRHQKRLFHMLIAIRELMANHRASLISAEELQQSGGDATEIQLQNFVMCLHDVPIGLIQRIVLFLPCPPQ